MYVLVYHDILLQQLRCMTITAALHAVTGMDLTGTCFFFFVYIFWPVQ